MVLGGLKNIGLFVLGGGGYNKKEDPFLKPVLLGFVKTKCG